MILLITRKDDVHADLVIGELRNLGADYFRWNTDCSHDYKIRLSPHDGFCIANSKSGKSLCDNDIMSVWLRRRSFPKIRDLSAQFREFTNSEWQHFYRSIWVSLRNKFWVNQPHLNDAAAVKWHQLTVAKECGFTVPYTVYTNDGDALKNADNLGSQVIYKAHDVGALAGSSDLAIYTSAFDRKAMSTEFYSDMSLCPGIYQPLIEKLFELRVTVVGDQVFAARIDSQASPIAEVDWRRAELLDLRHEQYSLTKDDALRCISLVRRLGLKFAALDIVATKNESLVFLELNSNGQWGWIQEMTRQPIARAIAQLLHEGGHNCEYAAPP